MRDADAPVDRVDEQPSELGLPAKLAQVATPPPPLGDAFVFGRQRGEARLLDAGRNGQRYGVRVGHGLRRPPESRGLAVARVVAGSRPPRPIAKLPGEMSGGVTTGATGRRALAGRDYGGLPPRRWPSQELPRDRRALGVAALACLGLAALSLLLPSTPTYDPWAWIVWGREVASLDLDTRFGPSWKPLPVLFTTPFSLLGGAAPELWLVGARAGALFGLLAAFRLAGRLGGPLAGALAALTLALSDGYLRGSALGYSEGLLVALVFLGVERHLAGRRGQALLLGFAAGLLRPETWPFLGLYALFVFVREARLRRLATGLMALLPVLWLGPELWGSGDALRAASRAQDPTLLSPAFADRPALAVLARAEAMVPAPAEAGAALAVLLSALGAGARPWRGEPSRGLLPHAVGDARRARVTLVLALVAAAWLGLVAVMTELGYAGNSRYLAMPIALCCVLGGIGLGWLARGLAAAVRRIAAGRDAVTRGVALALPAAIVLACPPFLADPLTEVAGDAREVRDEARLNADLPEALRRTGGRERVLTCGTAYATALQVPVLAWHLGVPTGRVGIEPRSPGVYFRGPPGLQPPDAAAPPVTAGGLRPVARVGEWTVSAACPRQSTDRRRAGEALSYGR